MKEIKKSNYCCHGKSLETILPDNFNCCSCCRHLILYEEKEILGKESKLCSWCLLKPIKEELL